jgi:glycosyltransferase involved in cell wall biosynthesis
MVQPVDVPQDLPLGDYVALAGRVTPEKGIDTVMRAAVILKDVPFQVAGSYHSMPNLPSTTGPNFLFRGHLGPVELDSFYRHARMLVLASVCYETFGFAQVEGMMRAKPVLCSGIGGLPEIVDDGVTGLVFKPGDATELAEKVRYLWDRPDLCRQMGMAGRAKALRVYSPESVYERLMAAYEKAIALGSGGAKMT